MIGIENWNSGYLTHRILDPQVLSKYLEAIEDDLEVTLQTMNQCLQMYTSITVIHLHRL